MGLATLRLSPMFPPVNRLFALVFFLITLPVIAQQSIVVADANSGKILVAQNARAVRPVASLTKMATASVVLDWSRATSTDLGAIAVVPVSAGQLTGANPMGLQPGDQITLRNALYSALLGSDNFSALTLADHVGRQLLIARGRQGDPVKTFVAEMNALMKAIGATQTKFINPHGLDVGGKSGKSTAVDMAVLAARVFRDSGFVFFAEQESRKVSYLRGGQTLEFVVKNTNQLLGADTVVAGKTGQTRAAGPCLALGAQKSTLTTEIDAERTAVTKRFLVSVVLGSPDRFGQSRAVLQQGWAEYEKWRMAGFPTGQPGAEYIPVTQ